MRINRRRSIDIEIGVVEGVDLEPVLVSVNLRDGREDSISVFLAHLVKLATVGMAQVGIEHVYEAVELQVLEPLAHAVCRVAVKRIGNGGVVTERFHALGHIIGVTDLHEVWKRRVHEDIDGPGAGFRFMPAINIASALEFGVHTCLPQVDKILVSHCPKIDHPREPPSLAPKPTTTPCIRKATRNHTTRVAHDIAYFSDDGRSVTYQPYLTCLFHLPSDMACASCATRHAKRMRRACIKTSCVPAAKSRHMASAIHGGPTNALPYNSADR